MKAIFHTAIAASIGLAVVSCGGSKSSPAPRPSTPAPTTFEVTGQAIKGIIDGGLVEVYSADDLKAPIGYAYSDMGSYTVDVEGAPAGVYLVRVTATDDTTMICDARPTCGDVEFGDTIPATQLADLSLSSITIADETGKVEANVNVITTLTTDVLLAAADANEDVDLAEVNEEQLKGLQQASSKVVGGLIGIDLSTTNVYDVKVVDVTQYNAESVVDASTSFSDSLSTLNASYATLSEDGQTISEAIDAFTTNVESIAVLTLAPDFEETAEYTDLIAALTVKLESAEIAQQAIKTVLAQDYPELTPEPTTTTPVVEEFSPTLPTGSTGSVSE